MGKVSQRKKNSERKYKRKNKKMTKNRLRKYET